MTSFMERDAFSADASCQKRTTRSRATAFVYRHWLSPNSRLSASITIVVQDSASSSRNVRAYRRRIRRRSRTRVPLWK